jgi:hypothetical protein
MVNAQVLGEAGPQGALPQGEMPGGLPGENFVRLNFVAEADIDQEDPDAVQGTPTADQTPVVEDDEEDEEEDESVEEVCIFFPPLLVSVLNVLRSRRCQFVSCEIWSVVFGVLLMSRRKTHQKANHTRKPSWMA